MKQKVKGIAVVFLVLLVFSSCVSTGVYDLQKEEIVSDNYLKVFGNGLIEKHTFMIYGFSLVSNQGVSITIENLTDSPVVINWDKSSIAYRGMVSNIFISGQKYITAGASIPPLTLSGNGKKSVDIIPANNVSIKDGEWKIGKMGLGKDEVLSLTINYEHNNESKFITLNASPKNGSIKWGF